MIERIFAREINPDEWQWHVYDDKNPLLESELQTGDSEELIASMSSTNTHFNVVLRGQQVVSTKVALDAKQRKHAAKLIPYELEDELSSSVDGLHFAFAQTSGDDVAVLYAEQEACAGALHTLNEQGCDIHIALPDYLLLKIEPDSATLLLENNILTVRVSEHWGFSIESDLAPVLLQRLALHSALKETPPNALMLIAESDEALAQLEGWLPESWNEIERENTIGGFWDCIDIDVTANGLNLCRGKFSRQLPYVRWWGLWKLPAYFVAAAFILAILVNFGMYFSAKSDEKQIRENINTVYLDALPNGRLGDVERILESKLGSTANTNSKPTNLVFLLSKVTEIISVSETTRLNSYSYSGDQGALQLTLEFSSLGALGDFRSKLENVGVSSDSPRTTSIGDGYQARMKVQEKNNGSN